MHVKRLFALFIPAMPPEFHYNRLQYDIRLLHFHSFAVFTMLQTANTFYNKYLTATFNSRKHETNVELM